MVNFGPWAPGCLKCGASHWWVRPAYAEDANLWEDATREVAEWLGEPRRCPNSLLVLEPSPLTQAAIGPEEGDRSSFRETLERSVFLGGSPRMR